MFPEECDAFYCIFRVVLHNWLLWRSSHENYQKESSLLLFTVQLSFGCKNKMNNSNGLEDHTGMMTGEEWVFESTGSSYMFLVDEPSLFWILKDWSVSWFHLAQPNPLCMSFKSLLYVHLWQQLIVIRYKKPCLDICIHLQTSSGAWVCPHGILAARDQFLSFFPCRTYFFLFSFNKILFFFTAKALLFHTIKWSLKLSHVAWIMTKIVGQNHTCKFQSYLLCRSTFFSDLTSLLRL